MFKVYDTQENILFPTEFEIRSRAIDLAVYLNRECGKQFRYVVNSYFSEICC